MNIAIIAGSNRKQSASSRLCRYIAKELTEKGCDVALFDLYIKPVPFYSPDKDAEDDSNVIEMKKAVRDADAIVLATPEYHGGISGVLKNALDHMGSELFSHKAVLAVSSAGGAVGVSSLQQIQIIVRNVHGVNCPEWISIGGEQRTFNAEGEPEQSKVKERTLRALNAFLDLAAKLSADR